jgi:hypothetical protein
MSRFGSQRPGERVTVLCWQMFAEHRPIKAEDSPKNGSCTIHRCN